MVQKALAVANLTSVFTGAETQSFTEFMKSHTTVSLMDHIPVAEREAVRNYTATTLADDALTDAIAALPESGGTIWCSAGLYNFTTEKHLHKRINFIGEGCGYYDVDTGTVIGALTRFVFAANKAGFVFHRRDTDETGILSPALPAIQNAGGSRFEGIYIKGSGSTATCHGLWQRTSVFWKDCIIDGFGGNGLNAVGSINWTLGGNTDEFVYGSVNQYTFNNITVINCGQNGVFVKGQDANAGWAIGIKAYNNALHGIRDESFLGNNWIACHTGGNANAYYLSNTTGAGGLFGCTSSSDEGASTISSRQSVWGGDHQAGFVSVSTTDIGDWAVPTGFILDKGKLVGGFSSTIGTTPNRSTISVMKHVDAALAFNREGDTGKGYRMAAFTTSSGTWDRYHGTTVLEACTTSLSSAASVPYKDEDATTIPSANLILPQGEYFPSLHDAGKYRKFQFRSGSKAASSSGTAGNVTYTAAEVLSGAIVRDCKGAGRTDTLPTAALLVAAIKNGAGIGQIIECTLTNGSDADETITLNAGTGGSFDTNQTAASRVVPWKTARKLRIRLTNVSPGTEAYQVVM